MLFSTLVVETGFKAFAQLYNFSSRKEQQRAEGERVRKKEKESVREREKRSKSERIQNYEKRVLNSEGEFLTCFKFSRYPYRTSYGVLNVTHTQKRRKKIFGSQRVNLFE